MGQPIPFDIRRKIIRERSGGKSYPQIVKDLGYPASVVGVRKIYKRYLEHGEEGLQTDCHRSGRRPKYGEDIRQQVEELRKGERGAPYINSRLWASRQEVPCARTIQRWWKMAGSNRAKKGKTKAGRQDQLQAHDVWEVDGKEQIAIQTGELNTWMNVVDKATGADLFAEIFPPEQSCPDRWPTPVTDV